MASRLRRFGPDGPGLTAATQFFSTKNAKAPPPGRAYAFWLGGKDGSAAAPLRRFGLSDRARTARDLGSFAKTRKARQLAGLVRFGWGTRIRT